MAFKRYCRRALAVCICLAVFGLHRSAPAATSGRARGPSAVELDVRSDYSHIRVKRQGNVRSLFFVRDKGEEVLETSVNLNRPYEIMMPYARFMFASYLIQPQQRDVLLVGLGGGAMVHFYRHYDPQVRLEVVEIDPVVVDIADRYFHVRSENNLRIITADGLQYVRDAKTRYDVIYMDAFLKPSRDTDATGVSLRQKTIEFYKGLQEKLAPDGAAVINLNLYSGTPDDLALLRSVFVQVYVFRAPGGNYIVIGTAAKSRLDTAALRERAGELDRRFKATFAFPELVNGLAR
jgi:spermidine synthase